MWGFTFSNPCLNAESNPFYAKPTHVNNLLVPCGPYLYLKIWFIENWKYLVQKMFDWPCDGWEAPYCADCVFRWEVSTWGRLLSRQHSRLFLSISVHHICDVMVRCRHPRQKVPILLGSPELLDDVDAYPVKHLTNGGHLAFEEDGHQPMAVVRHGVQEPSACRKVWSLTQFFSVSFL